LIYNNNQSQKLGSSRQALGWSRAKSVEIIGGGAKITLRLGTCVDYKHNNISVTLPEGSTDLARGSYEKI